MIINLKSQMQNTSLQVGDIAYFSTSVENVGIGQVAGEPYNTRNFWSIITII